MSTPSEESRLARFFREGPNKWVLGVLIPFAAAFSPNVYDDLTDSGSSSSPATSISVEDLSEACSTLREEGIELINDSFTLEEITRIEHPYEDTCGELHSFITVQEAASGDEEDTPDDTPANVGVSPPAG